MDVGENFLRGYALAQQRKQNMLQEQRMREAMAMQAAQEQRLREAMLFDQQARAQENLRRQTAFQQEQADRDATAAAMQALQKNAMFQEMITRRQEVPAFQAMGVNPATAFGAMGSAGMQPPQPQVPRAEAFTRAIPSIIPQLPPAAAMEVLKDWQRGQSDLDKQLMRRELQEKTFELGRCRVEGTERRTGLMEESAEDRDRRDATNYVDQNIFIKNDPRVRAALAAYQAKRISRQEFWDTVEDVERGKTPGAKPGASPASVQKVPEVPSVRTVDYRKYMSPQK